MTRPSVHRGAIVAAALLLSACQRGKVTGPYEPAREIARDPRRAQELTRRAAEMVEAEPARAEALLREALTADLHHGPAHNNLGVIFLERGELYEAAVEFEWARKLMPGHPDPRLNLGLVFERAGRVEEALDAYAAALEVYPGHLPSMQAAACLRVRSGREDSRTAEHLDEIALRGDERWREWARSILERRTP